MIGRLLQNRYKVLDQIGMGSISMVYLGLDVETRQVVAIKMLRPAVGAGEDFVRRFRREAALLSRLSHPGVVQILDFGVEEGQNYIVLEYVPGKTLGEILEEKRPLSVSEALDITCKVAQGLAATNAERIVHRDIKPHNIMVTADGQVKLVDFGIAGSISAAGSTTGFLGTPYYISPEQADYKEESIDIRSDIYSLGVVLFEMLSGRVPFDADSPIRIVTKHINEPAPDIRTLRGDIPSSVAALLSRCLAKKRDERFRSPTELMAAVDRARADLPPERAAAPPPVGAARLIGPSNTTLALTKPHVTIGRNRPERGIVNDIDLSPWDERAFVSGRQALLELKGGRWFLSDTVGVPNPTWLNRRHLKRGEEAALSDGDEIQFGGPRVGYITLVFRQ